MTLVAPGTYERYYQEMRKEGADLARLKPPHMNPTDAALSKLLRLGGQQPP